ncbi:hypothetical protein SARC_01145 [Sphaeroforma arctica JP610]|uniref:Uncharacterized protein n=1 Tax=Sphaeroforma arctica JP610 TaxID=667725 RepID=A0A0L0GCI8_9EUKA|nr:hypothetical protein SARC_01145 [Sphaeroforma arctica JP610]KNC86725.1 hypothetical protein SARC_01145 [Sphaeroforma arctica JP610]|eukprot:XP_014160627.1 hypothetical protein SARC_01145 [Sphaeroforma arctica JP610]
MTVLERSRSSQWRDSSDYLQSPLPPPTVAMNNMQFVPDNSWNMERRVVRNNWMVGLAIVLVVLYNTFDDWGAFTIAVVPKSGHGTAPL